MKQKNLAAVGRKKSYAVRILKAEPKVPNKEVEPTLLEEPESLELSLVLLL